MFKAGDSLEKLSINKDDYIRKLVNQKIYRADFSLLAKAAFYGVNYDVSIKEISNMRTNIRKHYFDLLLSNMSIVRKLELTCFVINYDFSSYVIKNIKVISGGR